MGNQSQNLRVIVKLKSLLFLYNIGIWINGVILFLFGLWAELDLNKYLELSPEFSGIAPHVIIGIAGLVILISSIAFFCIIKGQQVLLYIYSGFLACIFMIVAGMAVSVIYYRQNYGKTLHDGLKHTIETYNPEKDNFDYAQTNMACCGIYNYTDWIVLSPQHVIPVSCCIDPNDCVIANYSHVFQHGCQRVITKYISYNMNLLIAIVLGTTLLPPLNTILSCSLATRIKKCKYDSMNKQLQA